MKEPIAIVGIGCRFPGGGDGPAAFWRFLRRGGDGIREVPEDRWSADAWTDPVPGRIGKSITRRAGFIDEIDRFDAGFFGISPREAALMDPQQRLLLETAWWALEDAGLLASRLRRAPVGVFVGISTHDYELLQSSPEERSDVDVYTTTGGVASIAANRISYVFDLRGPSVAVDTACSSSLVAAHLACRSLAEGDCSLALVGGVNALLAPMPFVAFSRMGMLSPDGQCKAFDASANGFVRAEGAGIAVLKPLSAALADGDRIYAVIRATASNQDGRTNGITVPNPEAQAELVRSACATAGVDPADVSYVEAHGTGTLVGDPIEARALGTSLGAGRSADHPLVVGSVKTNIGHLEAGAGIAGLVKLALVLDRGEIPPNLHFVTPNPAIDFEALKIRVPTALEPFPETRWPRLGAVNSFGFGGANAHAILEARPEPARRRATVDVPEGLEPSRDGVLLLSARNREALGPVAARWRDHLAPDGDGAGHGFAALCAAAALRRDAHPHRLAVVARSHDEATQALEAYGAGEARPHLFAAEALADGEAKSVFVFSGQGPQWWAMGRELLGSEPVFRERIECCDRIVRELGGWSLLEELSRGEADSRLDVTAIAQPAIYALQVGLLAVWESWGVRPAAVLGHSVGEVAAAVAAGVLDVEEGCRVIFHRGRTMDLAPERGRMLAVRLPAAEAEALVAAYGGAVSVGARNAPTSVTLSGDGGALEEIAAALEARDVAIRFLPVRYAFHSAQMDPVRDELLRSLGRVAARRASGVLVSTVTGGIVSGEELDVEYWWRNVRGTVRFADAVLALVARGHRVFVEVAPHPVLSASVAECLASRTKAGFVLSSLRRQAPERRTMLATAGALHALGAAVDWRAILGAADAATPLPVHPWQRERFWHESDAARDARFGRGLHPFLGRRLVAADPTFEGWLDAEALPWLGDHRVHGRIVFPAAASVEATLGLARAALGDVPLVVEEMDFLKPLFVGGGNEATRVELVFRAAEGRFALSSRTGDGEWTVHASGNLRRLDDGPPPPLDLDEIRARCAERVSARELYRRFASVGLDFGPAFRGIETAWRRDGEALGRVRLPAPAGEASRFRIHPALLDACFQVLSAALPPSERGRLFLPVQIERLRFHGRPRTSTFAHARLVRSGGNAVVADLVILDRAGRVLAEVEGFRCQAVSGPRAANDDDPARWIYESRWIPRPIAGQAVVAHPATTAPPTRALAVRARAVLAARQRGPSHRRRFLAIEPALDALVCGYVVAAFRALRWSPRRGERVVPEALARRLGIAARHRKLFARLLGILREDRILRAAPGALRVARVPDAADLDAAWRQLLARFPAFHAELALVRRAGTALAAVLRGVGDPLGAVAPGGSLATLDHLYEHGPSFADYGAAVGEAVAALVDAWPRSRRLRILEIGAGTGGLTASVVPRLPRDRTEYVFTDVSPAFLAHAEQKLFDLPFVSRRLFDAERSPAEQGIEPGSFDLVLAADALHATRRLGESLAHTRELLVRGGLLCLLETDRPPRWVDLVFGLLEGWWRFEDAELRPERALLDAAGWRRALGASGFSDVAVVGDAVGPRRSGHAIFLARAADEPPAATVADRFEPSSAAEAGGNGSARRRWLVIADRGGLASRLAERLEARGDSVALVGAGATNGRRPGALSREGFVEVVDEVAPDAVVFLGALDAPEVDEASAEALRAAEAAGPVALLDLAASLGERAGEPPRLVVVTRGSQAVGEAPVAPPQAMTWGLGRVVQNELRKLRARLVDLDPADSADGAADALVRELEVEDGEEVAYRAGERFASRLVRSSVAELPRSHRDGDEGAFRVALPASGVLDDVVVASAQRHRPRAGEVEIEVAASGVNFRDVMKALGIYPIEGDADLLLGDECAGRVVRVGRGVRDVRPGDEVIVLAGGLFASHVVADARALSRKPRSISFEEAATLPVAYLTAWYALRTLAGIRAAETVLVHAGTGGVGIAAIHVARLVGVEPIATAGTAEKRDFLRGLGVRHVLDSRSLRFADEVRAITSGRGVDVVLNSLAGEAIGQGLAALAPHGRFLEIGKRDIYQNTRVGLRPFRKSLSFHSIDLPRVLADEPVLVRRLVDEILRHVAKGDLPPLPHRIFPISQVARALRSMAKAEHVGKLVLSANDPVARRASRPAPSVPIRADATYLVTGGLGGFGLAIAEWLASRGAGALVLAGRSGADRGDARQALARLRRAGNRVVVARLDVTDETAVRHLFRRIARRLPPLRGIVHGAMVLDDAILRDLDAERFRRATAPKVLGAANLHRASRPLDLDFFLLLSSVSSVVGAPAQGNYVAGNAFLDALAHHRRRLGLPALAVHWGQIGEVGFVARHAKVEEILTRQGLLPIRPAEATALLGPLLGSEAAEVGVVRVDWQRWASYLPALAAAPRYSELVRTGALEEGGRGDGFRDSLLAKPPAERATALAAHLREQVAKVLRTSAARLALDRPLAELGVDSLVAFELLNRLEDEFRVSLPPSRLGGASTISGLAAALLEVLASGDSGRAGAATNGTGAPGERLVVLRADGPAAPLFAIHPAGGLVNLYAPLAEALGGERPFLGLQSRAITGAEEHETIAALAEDYATIVDAHQPDGMLHLLGFSLGALFALATTVALERRGRIVAFLGLVDADLRIVRGAAASEAYVARYVAETYASFARHVGIVRPLDPAMLAEAASRLSRRLIGMPGEERGAAVAEWLTERHLLEPGISPALVRRYFALFDAHVALVEGASFEPVRAPIHLWRAVREAPQAPVPSEEIADFEREWRRLAANGLSDEALAASHYELLFPPCVETLARAIEAAVSSAAPAPPAGALPAERATAAT